jgi:hypothetical protein
MFENFTHLKKFPSCPNCGATSGTLHKCIDKRANPHNSKHEAGKISCTKCGYGSKCASCGGFVIELGRIEPESKGGKQTEGSSSKNEPNLELLVKQTVENACISDEDKNELVKIAKDLGKESMINLLISNEIKKQKKAKEKKDEQEKQSLEKAKKEEEARNLENSRKKDFDYLMGQLSLHNDDNDGYPYEKRKKIFAKFTIDTDKNIITEFLVRASPKTKGYGSKWKNFLNESGSDTDMRNEWKNKCLEIRNLYSSKYFDDDTFMNRINEVTIGI